MTPILPFQAKCKGVLVAVPEGSKSFTIGPTMLYECLCFINDSGMSDVIPLSPGHWHIEGFTDELTVEQMEKVCESYSHTVGWSAKGNKKSLPKITLYMNYIYEKPVPVSMLCTSVPESFHTLLRSLGATNQRYLLLTEKI